MAPHKVEESDAKNTKTRNIAMNQVKSKDSNSKQGSELLEAVGGLEAAQGIVNGAPEGATDVIHIKPLESIGFRYPETIEYSKDVDGERWHWNKVHGWFQSQMPLEMAAKLTGRHSHFSLESLHIAIIEQHEFDLGLAPDAAYVKSGNDEVDRENCCHDKGYFIEDFIGPVFVCDICGHHITYYESATADDARRSFGWASDLKKSPFINIDDDFNPDSRHISPACHVNTLPALSHNEIKLMQRNEQLGSEKKTLWVWVIALLVAAVVGWLV